MGNSGSDWRDWANHPEAVTAIWPRVMSSGIPPSTWLALLGTCLRTRLPALCEAQRTKLAVQLGPEQPDLRPLQLLKQSGRTQPTILALLQSCSTGQPATAGNAVAQDLLARHAASANAHRILSHSALLGCITRLDLQGVVPDPQLLQTIKRLNALRHLHLSNVELPYSTVVYQAANLPQGVCTLHIELRPDQPFAPPLTSLLTEFLVLDTITDLTITSSGDIRPEGFTRACWAVLETAAEQGKLRKVSLPHALLCYSSATALQHALPLLEELQVFGIQGELAASAALSVVSWRTLHVHDLDLTACRYLPLGGTEPLDIHVSGKLWALHGGRLSACIHHLTSPRTRPVRLVGSGRDGGAFSWAGSSGRANLGTALHALQQLSQAPVRRLDLSIRSEGDVEQLLTELQPLQALTQLSLLVTKWDAAGGTHDQVLAQLPLHVGRVRLDCGGYSLHRHGLFKRMAVTASTVPGCQAYPLHLFVVGVGPGSEVWEAVDECRGRGGMGVVMEKAWE